MLRKVSCGNCQSSVELPEKLSSPFYKCPHCQKHFPVPQRRPLSALLKEVKSREKIELNFPPAEIKKRTVKTAEDEISQQRINNKKDQEGGRKVETTLHSWVCEHCGLSIPRAPKKQGALRCPCCRKLGLGCSSERLNDKIQAQKGLSSNQELFIQAVKNGLTHVVEEALREGTNPNFFDGNKMSPFMLASEKGYSDIAQLIRLYNENENQDQDQCRSSPQENNENILKTSLDSDSIKTTDEESKQNSIREGIFSSTLRAFEHFLAFNCDLSVKMKALIKNLRTSEHPLDRARICRAIGESGSEGLVALDLLIDAMLLKLRIFRANGVEVEYSHDVSHAAASAISEFGEAASAAVPSLILALRGDKYSNWTRRNAAFALGKIGQAAVSSVPALVEASLTDLDSDVSRTARESISKNFTFQLEAGGFAIPTITEILMSKKRDIQELRWRAMWLLDVLGNNGVGAVKAIKSVMNDHSEESSFRVAAKEIFHKLGKFYNYRGF